MQENHRKKAGLSGRWLKIALVLSLVLNLAILGTIAGAFLRFHHDDVDGVRRAPDPALMPYGLALSREQRRDITKELSKKGFSRYQSQSHLKENFDRLLSVLRREPFNVDRLKEVLEMQSERILQRANLAQELFVDEIASMSQEERQEFIKKLEKIFNKRRDIRQVDKAH